MSDPAPLSSTGDPNVDLRADAAVLGKDADATEARNAQRAKWTSFGAMAADGLISLLEVASGFVPGISGLSPAIVTALEVGRLAIDASMLANKVTLPQASLDALGGLLKGGVKWGIPNLIEEVLPPDQAAAALPGVLAWSERESDAALALAKKALGG